LQEEDAARTAAANERNGNNGSTGGASS
jgi:hypothetical protein